LVLSIMPPKPAKKAAKKGGELRGLTSSVRYDKGDKTDKDDKDDKEKDGAEIKRSLTPERKHAPTPDEHEPAPDEEPTSMPASKRPKTGAAVEEALQRVILKDPIPQLGDGDDVTDWIKKVEGATMDQEQRFSLAIGKVSTRLRYAIEHACGRQKTWGRMVKYLVTMKKPGPTAEARESFLKYVMLRRRWLPRMNVIWGWPSLRRRIKHQVNSGPASLSGCHR